MVDFGTDVSSFPDFDTTGRTISDVEAVAECCLRRLTTENGSLEYDPTFGEDLSDLLNDDFGPGELQMRSARAETQLELDERIRRASVSLDLDAAAHKLVIRISGELVDDREFEFVLGIDAVSADVLKVS